MLLADDHPVYRDGLAALLGSVPGIDVVGTAGTGGRLSTGPPTCNRTSS